LVPSKPCGRELLEEQALAKEKKPSWYGRFVDDIVTKIKNCHVDSFHQTLNSVLSYSLVSKEAKVDVFLFWMD
jgi:hypothetical protein